MGTGIIRASMRAASRSEWLDTKLRTLCELYLDVSRGFSYDFDENGEQTLLNRIAKTTEGGGTFFDVGANVGNWTQRALDVFPGAFGHLFEAAPSTFTELKRRYGNSKSLSLNAVALAETVGEHEFRHYRDGFGGNTLLVNADYHGLDGEVIQVETTTGDKYCESREIETIDILKIDTEGSELQVLQGFASMLNRNAIKIIQFEYGYTHADVYTTMRDFFDLFEEQGYIVGPLRLDGVRFKKFDYKDNEFKSGPNYVACIPEWRDELASPMSYRKS